MSLGIISDISKDYIISKLIAVSIQSNKMIKSMASKQSPSQTTQMIYTWYGWTGMASFRNTIKSLI